VKSLYELTEEDAQINARAFHASLMPTQERWCNPHYQDCAVIREAMTTLRTYDPADMTRDLRAARRRLLAFWSVEEEFR
jgi:hypothetical protein